MPCPPRPDDETRKQIIQGVKTMFEITRHPSLQVTHVTPQRRKSSSSFSFRNNCFWWVTLRPLDEITQGMSLEELIKLFKTHKPIGCVFKHVCGTNENGKWKVCYGIPNCRCLPEVAIQNGNNEFAENNTLSLP